MIEVGREFRDYVEKLDLSPATIKAYTQDVAIFSTYLHKNSSKLSRENALAFIALLKEQGLSTARIARVISSLKIYWLFLKEKQQVSSCLSDIASPKITHTLPVYCSPLDREKLMAACDKDRTMQGVRAKLLVHMLYFSGVPLQTLVRLKTADIELSPHCLFFSYKTNRYSCPLDTDFYTQLVGYTERSPLFLFPTLAPSGEQIQLSASAAWALLKKILTLIQPQKKLAPKSIANSFALEKKLERARQFYDKAHPRS